MTDSNNQPLTPNYVPGVGRLATSRFEFEQHIEGTNYRQQAGTVDLFPTLVISSVTYTTVQEALAALAANSNTPTVPNATNSSLGLIQLGGDLQGSNSAVAPRVSGLQGRPVSNVPPTNGYVLTWNGTTWLPLSPPNYSLGGDLSGITSNATVVRIQGNPIANTAPTTGQLLGWNGSAWAPTSNLTLPSGAALNANSGSNVNLNTGSQLTVYPSATAILQGSTVDITIPSGSSFFTLSGANTTFNSNININGTALVNSGADVVFQAGSTFIMSGSSTDFICTPANFTMTVPSGGDLICDSGSLAVFGGTVDMTGTMAVASKTYYGGRTVTTSYTVDSSGSDNVILCNNSGTISVFFPSGGATEGRLVWVKNINSSGSVELVGTGGPQVEGGSYNMNGTLEGAAVYWDGTNWWILNRWNTA